MAVIQIDRLLETCVRRGASDLHLAVGKPPTLRLNTHLRELQTKVLEPEDTAHLESDENAKEVLQRGVEILADLQQRLYAQDKWGVLLIFQAMDAAGKDGTIKHVMSGVDPQGCQVTSFKQPSEEELDHDWMWRCWKALPERGRIGIFEMMVMNNQLRELAFDRSPTNKIRKAALASGMKSLLADGKLKVLNGTTTAEEIVKVAQVEGIVTM